MAQNKTKDQEKEFLFSFDILVRLLEIVFRRKRILFSVFILVFIGTFLILSISKSSYEAEGIIVLFPSTIKETKDSLSELMPVPLTVQDYQIFLMSDSVLYEVMERMAKTGMFEKIPTFKEMRESIGASVQVIEKTATQIQYSSVIILKARSDSGKKAAKIADIWAEVAVESSMNHYKFGTKGMKAFLFSEIENVASNYDTKIKTSADRIEKVLTELNERKKELILQLNAFKDEKDDKINELVKSLNVDYLKQELGSVKEIMTSQELILAGIRVQIQVEEERIKSLSSELEKTPSKLVLNRGLTDTAMALLSSQKGEIQEEIKDKTIVGEEKNQVYYTLSEQISQTKAELEALKKEKEVLEVKIVENEKKFKDVFSRIQDAEFHLAQLTRELEGKEKIMEDELNEKVQRMEKFKEWETSKIGQEIEGQGMIFNALVKKYLSSQLAEAGTTPDLKIFSPAKIPTQALPRRRVTRSFTIALISFIMCFFVIVSIDSLKQRKTVTPEAA
jgi:uncharacterized protein involved in exopolysaccharide biosynthesis